MIYYLIYSIVLSLYSIVLSLYSIVYQLQISTIVYIVEELIDLFIYKSIKLYINMSIN